MEDTENQKNTESKEEELPKEEETIKEFLNKIQALEKEKGEYLEALKRAKGDLLRVKNEFEEKMKEIQEMAASNLIYYLLNVLDNFDIAFQKSNQNEVDKGFYLIYSQLKDVLQKFGLKEIEALNKKFDPNFHEVIMVAQCSRENCDQSDDGLVVEVLSKGYLLNGRVLRPARVKVINHG
ncbi:MAG: nucleotide exchange factor GrpE [Patescibacteria group bacterium]|nr:nucleotide exchange factor GrpE [Patescibacteria group bacterium]